MLYNNANSIVIRNLLRYCGNMRKTIPWRPIETMRAILGIQVCSLPTLINIFSRYLQYIFNDKKWTSEFYFISGVWTLASHDFALFRGLLRNKFICWFHPTYSNIYETCFCINDREYTLLWYLFFESILFTFLYHFYRAHELRNTVEIPIVS